MNWNVSRVLNQNLQNIINEALGIRILMVTDGSGGHVASFGPGDPNDTWFGLSEVLRTLNDTSHFLTNFFVTKAHRDTDPGDFTAMSPQDQALFRPDFQNFKFDAHDLNAYDEIWLFGVGGVSETNPLTDSELAAIATFMQNGVGVFATGDHEDLGVQLCGRIPRVRSMRKWYFPNPGPLGEPVAPEAIGADRYDTTRAGHDGQYVFDDQSDDIPQAISPRLYSIALSAIQRVSYPHPLLCGPLGTIDVMPDHMHEGEVITPWELNRTFTFAGKHFTEYPNNPNTGKPPVPEIIAWNQVLRHETPSTENEHIGDPSNFTNPRTFGSIGAYDGHLAKVGRIVTDSTWHHFFDINLIGDPVAPPPKTQGFKASADGQTTLAAIQAYYRNIGLWLAPSGRLRNVWAGMVAVARLTHPLNEMLRFGANYDTARTMEIGLMTRSILLRLMPDCAFSVIFAPVAGPVYVPPWVPIEGNPGIVVDPMIYEVAAIGGAVTALAREVPLNGVDSNADPREVIARGTQAGLGMLSELMHRQGEVYLAAAKKLFSVSKASTQQ